MCGGDLLNIVVLAVADGLFGLCGLECYGKNWEMDIKSNSLTVPPPPFLFIPFLQVYRFKMSISEYVSLIYITGGGGEGGNKYYCFNQMFVCT